MASEPSVIETRCLICSEDPEQCDGCAAADAPGKVVSIVDRRPVSGTLNDEDSRPFREEVVEQLEGLLERARAGAFTGFAAVLNGDDDMTVIATQGALEYPILFLGGLARVSHRINMETDLDED